MIKNNYDIFTLILIGVSVDIILILNIVNNKLY